MPRIHPVTTGQTDATTAATLQAVEAQFGMLPNLIATLARSPAALNGYLQFAEALKGGRLSDQQRELIALVVAQDNACEYCLSAHSAIARGVGLDLKEIERARRGEASGTVEAAITVLAHQVVLGRGGIGDEEVQAARAVGLDDGLIVEVVANVALNVLTNYINRVASTEIDFPHVPLESAA